MIPSRCDLMVPCHAMSSLFGRKCQVRQLVLQSLLKSLNLKTCSRGAGLGRQRGQRDHLRYVTASCHGSARFLPGGWRSVEVASAL